MRGAGSGGMTDPITALVRPTPSLPGLRQLFRSWRAEAGREGSPDFLPLVSLWALPQAPRPLLS